MSIKLLIADDHQLFREGLINLLCESPDIEIISNAENGKDAYEKSVIHNPDVVLMDIGMPGINGIEATRLIKKQLPHVKIIALSMHSDKHYIVGMLEAGASGYLFKNCTYKQLISAIKTVNSGKKYFSDEITEKLVDVYLDKGRNTDNKNTELTKRELEVLKLFCEGKSTRDISEQIFVSVKTVGTHKQHILEKLNLKTTVDMIKYAIKKGIISID